MKRTTPVGRRIQCSFFILLLVLTFPLHSPANLFGGIWRSSAASSEYSTGLTESEFLTLNSQKNLQGKRIISLQTYLEGSNRKWAGIWEAGSYTTFITMGLSFTEFANDLTARFNAGQRLIKVQHYLEGGAHKWAGIWRTGTGSSGLYLYWQMDEATLRQRMAELDLLGMQLVDLETYEYNGERLWAGVWLNGTGNIVEMDLTSSQLADMAQVHFENGVRLVDIETYETNAGRRWAALWREGNDGQYWYYGQDKEKFAARDHGFQNMGFGMIDLFSYDDGPSSACVPQIINQNYSYIYTISEGGGTYRWPVDTDAVGDFLRISALPPFGSEQFLYLPFNDRRVVRGGIWLYGANNWHQAGDFYILPNLHFDFPVLASAAGTVMFVGWDNWSGNYVIVSHDVDGVVDSYRTIYMHLRNGPSADCDASWNKSLPSLSGANEAKWIGYLNSSGCPLDSASRNPDPLFWGTEDQQIPVSQGQSVQRGQVLGWAGNTGPGGKGLNSNSNPNIHLHIFWCRRDPTNGLWYFFDPYGLYSTPGCYPSGLTDPIPNYGLYANLWRGAQPTYPIPTLQSQIQGSGGSLQMDLNWNDSDFVLESTSDLNDPWLPVPGASNSSYNVPFNVETNQFFRLKNMVP